MLNTLHESIAISIEISDLARNDAEPLTTKAGEIASEKFTRDLTQRGPSSPAGIQS